jgi:hypothetical protein
MISDITNRDEIISEQLGHNEITQIGVQGQLFSSIKLAQNVSEISRDHAINILFT